MLSSRQLPISEPGNSNLPSPSQGQNASGKYYQQNNMGTDPRTTQLGTSHKVGTSMTNTRLTSSGYFDPSTAPHITKFAVRQDHSSPLRASTHQNLIDGGAGHPTLMLRRDDLNTNAYSSINNNLFQTMKGSGDTGLSTLAYPQTSNKSTIQNMTSAISSIQKQQQTKGDLKHLRTPPIASQPYDELGGLEFNQTGSEEDHNLRLSKQDPSVDQEAVIMKLHGKVKSLEGRYIDLANFYKRELLAQGGPMQNSRVNPLKPSASASRDKLGQNKSKDDFVSSSADPESQLLQGTRKENSPQRQHTFDEHAEKALLSDLFKEKKDLELELEEMMQIRASSVPLNDDSDLNIEGRLRDQQRRMQTLDALRLRVGEVLTMFQDQFLEFINRNYQTFTENDVLELFSELRGKLEELLDMISAVPIYFNAKDTVKNAIQSYQSELQEGLKAALADYELSSGYTTQAIKKIAFELQSKHGTAQLDAKKAQISVQSIQKRCNYLIDSFQSSNQERSPAQTTQQSRMNSQSRMGSIIPPMSPSSQSNQQQRVVQEIQGHLQILSNSLYSISDKLMSSDDDLRYLVNDVEDEHNQLLDKFKTSLDRLLIDLSTNHTYDSGNSPGPLRGDTTNLSVGGYNNLHLEDINQQLQRELELAQRELDMMRNSDINLQMHPLNRVVSFGVNNQQHANTGYLNENLQLRLAQLESSNSYLSSEIRNLTRQLEEKTLQAERLAQDLAVSAASNPSNNSRSRERSRERVTLDQIQFYQKKYDDALRQTRDLVKLTQRFLQSMKRLQKAVHRKEPNVQQEKSEFEEARKDLEPRLKEIKREIEQIINPTSYNMGSNNSEHGRVDAQIHRYQNKIPHTFGERDRTGSAMSGSIDQKVFQRGGSEFRRGGPQGSHPQGNPYSNSIAYEAEIPQRQRSQGSSGKKPRPLSREKSPIMLKNSRNSASHQGVQRELYRTIESSSHTGANIHQQSQQHTVSSANKLKTQQSNTLIPRDDSQGRIPQQQKTPGKLNQSRDNTTSQSKILRQLDMDYNTQLDALNEDMKRLRSERDNLLVEIQQLQSANHSVQVQAERDLNKERLNREQLENEICRLSDVREALALQVQDMQAQIDDLQGQPESLEEAKVEDDINIETINSLQQENRDLLHRLEGQEQSSQQEAQKLKAQIDDVRAKAQSSISQLKERAQGKDLEIGQLRENLKDLESQVRAELMVSISEKQLLQDKISKVQQECEYKCQEMDLMLQAKDQEMTKLARQLDKTAQGDPQIVQLLRGQLAQAEGVVKTTNEENSRLKTQVAALGTEVAKARSEMNDKDAAQTKQLDRLKADYQTRLQQEKQALADLVAKANLDTIKAIREKEVLPLQDQLRDVEAQLQDLTNADTRLNEELQEAQSQLQALSEELQASEAGSHELKASYERKIADASSQIASLKSHLKDSQDLVKTLQQNDKEAQLTSHVEWLQGQITSYLSNIEKLNNQAQEISKEKQETLVKCDQRVKDSLKEAQALKAELESIKAELQSLAGQNQQLMDQNQDLKKRISENEQAIGEAEELVEQVQNENNDLQTQLREMTAQHSQQLLENQEDADSCIQDLRGRLLTVEVEHSQALALVSSKLEDANKVRKQEADTFAQTLTDMQKKVDKLQRDCDSYQGQNDKLRGQVEHIRGEYQAKVSDFEALQTRFHALLSERDGTLNATQTDMLELQTRATHLEQAKRELQRQLDDLQGQNEQVVQQYRDIELERDQLQEANNQLAQANQQSAKLESEYEEKVRILQSRVSSTILDYERLNADLQAQLARVQSLQIELKHLKQEKFDCETQAIEAKENLSITQADLKRLQEAHSFSQEEIARLVQTLAEAGYTIETLKAQAIKENPKQEQELRALEKELALERERHLSECSEWEKEVARLNRELQQVNEQGQVTLALQQQKSAALQTALDSTNQELQDSHTKLKDMQSVLEQQTGDFQDIQRYAQDLASQLETLQAANIELQKRIGQLERHAQGMEEDAMRVRTELAEVKGEKESLQQQMMELMNQSHMQQSEVQEVLHKQLQQALETLHTKSDELSQAQASLSDLQKAYRDQAAFLQDVEERAQQAEAAFEHHDQELQEKTQQLEDMQATHTKNRDLIMILKEEYKRASDKAALLDKTAGERAREWESERDRVAKEAAERDHLVEELRGQVKRLKEEFEMKNTEAQKAQVNLLEALNNKTETGVNSTYVRQIEEELKAKDELIEEANRYIEEFNDEKHALKAKFKHLMQILEDPDLPPEEESSYKEEDEIDLEQCFDQLEQHMQRSKKRVDTRLQIIAEDNSRLKDELEHRDEEVRVALDEMSKVNTELEEMKKAVMENDAEMRRQLENAKRKIEKYKAKLLEKQADIDDLNMKVLAAQEESKEEEQVEQPRLQTGKAEGLETENLFLLQKLQKAEQELQVLRSSEFQGNRPSKPDTDPEALEASFKLDLQRVQQMEAQLVNLRRQLFEAKDSVIDTLSEQFSKKMRDMQKAFTQDQLMKAKLSELRNNLESTLNNNVKVVKVVRFNSSLNGNEGIMKKLLIVQVISNNECYVLDETKLSESALGYVRSYLPEALDQDLLQSDEQHQSLPLESKHYRELKKLEEQVREIREERLELYQEMLLYKEKVKNQALSMSLSQDNIMSGGGQGAGFNELKGAELEEENIHLSAENLEVRQKLKQLSEKNHLLQQRVLELNDIIRELSDGASSPTLADGGKVVKLREENEQLRRQLSSQRHRYQQQAKKYGGQDEDQDDEEFDHNSFLQGIQVAENLGGITANQDGDNDFDQSSILLGVIEDLTHPITQHQQTQPKHQANPAGNYSEMQQVEKLQKECDELRQRLQQSVNQQNNASSVLMGGGGDPQGTLRHIKGTLLQFLKNCPLTDRNNEELLSIVFSMMEFTKDEIAEVQEFRTLKSKGAARAQSVSSGGGGGVGGTDPGEDEIRKKTSKGIFGIFSRGKSKEPTAQGKRTGSDKDESLTITPTKPLAPIGRR